jgi:ABC-2 type transport system permease protein
MRPTLLVFRREFAAYFATPVAAVFLIVFLALAAGLTFFMSGFFDRSQADLSGSFFWHPSRCACGPRNAAAAPSSS